MDFSAADGKDFFDTKCSACVSIVMELERNLELEQPRVNIDLRNTLRASNDQSKKVIPYEVSELRIIETVEELCPAMDQYGITKEENGDVTFQRYNAKGAGTVKIQGSMTLGSDEFEQNRRFLKSYCDSTVEEYADEFEEAIRMAGLAKLAHKQQELKLAQLKRNGQDVKDPLFDELDDLSKAYLTLGLDPIASPAEVKRAYRTLSRQLHPDKVQGEDEEKLAKFHETARAYEIITGEKLAPYGDLYRKVCIEIVGICDSDEDIEKVQRYFPSYRDSKLKGMMETEQDREERIGNRKKNLSKKRKDRKKKEEEDRKAKMESATKKNEL